MRNRPESPAELFEQLQYSPIDWPWKTTRLRRDPVQDVRQRASAAHPTAAEVYHRNSYLFPSRLGELPAAWLDADDVRAEFLERQAAAIPQTPSTDGERFPIAAPILFKALRRGRVPFCYGLELRLSDDSVLARYEPLTGRREPLRRNTREESQALAEALTTFGPSTGDPAERLFVIASFPRNEVLYGVRGYRRTLMEAGRVIDAIIEESGRQGRALSLILDFFDSIVNAHVGADGVEEATLAVLEFGGRR